MPRADLSKYLVHWTKGSDAEAFAALRAIVFERRIIGSSNAIRGGWTCVCFTEAPERAFHQVIGKYRPFGVQVPKAWLFSLGGRPVIYQPAAEYDSLPDQLRWRHMRYEPDANPPFDFSWEREWRIRTDSLLLSPPVTRILVPHQSWADALVDEHQTNEEAHVAMLASAYGDEYLQYPTEDFQFSISII
jgi:hypothetical protein